MSEYLYVCHFSNGHIKVGRSICPKSRIASHADRVACIGIELIDHHVVECDGHSAPAESALITWCTKLASKRNKSEWFEGLDFIDVCGIAEELAKVRHEPKNDSHWQVVISDIQRHGQMTQPQIAKAVGCSQTSVSELSRGKTTQPNYQLGAALIELLAHVNPTEKTPA